MEKVMCARIAENELSDLTNGLMGGKAAVRAMNYLSRTTE